MAVALIGFGTISCAKISDFDTPYMQESFMGAVAITPAVEGFSAFGRSTGVVTLVGDRTGKTVSVFGIPKNDPFEILPKVTLTDPAPTVSGFDAVVVDRRKIKITDFSSQNRAAEKLELQVTGTILRQGPRLATDPQDPIVITGRVGPILDYLPRSMRDDFIDKKTGRPIDKLDPNERVVLYQINVVNSVTSIL